MADAAAGLARRPASGAPPGIRRVVQVMGMPVTFDLRDELPPPMLYGLVEEALALLVRVDRTFSTYRPDSAVSQLARGAIGLDACGPDVREVLARCERLREETDGFFDARAGGALDPSGLVKGWAVERACALLLAGGSHHHCVNAGGDVRARGDAGAAAPGWHIGVRHPVHAAAVCCVLAGRDLAVATSAAYERGDHILDPHTGRPPHAPVASVTVTGPDLGAADAYATAAYAMGARCTRWLAERLPDGYKAYVAGADDRARHTPGLPVIAGG